MPRPPLTADEIVSHARRAKSKRFGLLVGLLVAFMVSVLVWIAILCLLLMGAW